MAWGSSALFHPVGRVWLRRLGGLQTLGLRTIQDRLDDVRYQQRQPRYLAEVCIDLACYMTAGPRAVSGIARPRAWRPHRGNQVLGRDCRVCCGLALSATTFAAAASTAMQSTAFDTAPIVPSISIA